MTIIRDGSVANQSIALESFHDRSPPREASMPGERTGPRRAGTSGTEARLRAGSRAMPAPAEQFSRGMSELRRTGSFSSYPVLRRGLSRHRRLRSPSAHEPRRRVDSRSGETSRVRPDSVAARRWRTALSAGARPRPGSRSGAPSLRGPVCALWRTGGDARSCRMRVKPGVQPSRRVRQVCGDPSVLRSGRPREGIGQLSAR